MTGCDAMYSEEYYKRDGLIETPFREHDVLRPDQASAFVYAFMDGRTPRCILSVGCGVGMLEQFFERFGVRVIGCDISSAAATMYRGSEFFKGNGATALAQYIDTIDTVIFCESLEHVPADQFDAMLNAMAKRTIRLIITNRLEYHPIDVNAWDHVHRLDDQRFKDISQKGNLRFHHGSHLVVDFVGVR